LNRQHILARLRAEAGSASPADSGSLGEQYVTLDQAAAIVGRSKRTLERYLNDPKYRHYGMPQPDVEGAGGKAHEWHWQRLRAWLEKTFPRPLPERFPACRLANRHGPTTPRTRRHAG